MLPQSRLWISVKNNSFKIKFLAPHFHILSQTQPQTDPFSNGLHLLLSSAWHNTVALGLAQKARPHGWCQLWCMALRWQSLRQIGTRPLRRDQWHEQKALNFAALHQHLYLPPLCWGGGPCLAMGRTCPRTLRAHMHTHMCVCVWWQMGDEVVRPALWQCCRLLSGGCCLLTC